MDGFESDVDCGGSECYACNLNRICDYSSDCWSGVCSDAKFCVNSAPAAATSGIAMTAAAVAAVAVLFFAL